MIKIVENKILVYKSKSLADATYTLNNISRGSDSEYTIEEKGGFFVCYKIEKLGKLAVSSTLAGIENMINQYFHSTTFKINPETLELTNSKGVVTAHKVEKKGKKFYFYYIQPGK